ncbi:MAG: diaminobutyrate--2-oxoglutarate transaminase [Planctomycetota bacterium]
MNTFERLESEVRSYCRAFPTVFRSASGSTMVDESGQEYIDFFAGAGSLNYGHNHPVLKKALIDYLASDGIVHALDMSTVAKREFLESFERRVLKPRELEYKVMFPGPTGTNAVESALKLARKVTGRTGVVSFTNGFHGMTLGSLAVTGNAMKRAGAGLPLAEATHVPFAGYLGDGVDTISVLEQLIQDGSSGLDQPAAFILETVQAEGGVNVASGEWLKRLAEVAKACGALLIVDDIQVGCGRTGPFFSFEATGVQPDVVCLSKSLSGYGLPFAIALLRPELDVWDPGEHNGTFRGHNAAFVTATAALETFWTDDALTRQVARTSKRVADRLQGLAKTYGGEWRGRGMIQGVAFEDKERASKISRAAFERGLIVETAGPDDEVLKFLAPLTIEDDVLTAGLDRLEQSFAETAGDRVPASAAR